MLRVATSRLAVTLAAARKQQSDAEWWRLVHAAAVSKRARGKLTVSGLPRQDCGSSGALCAAAVELPPTTVSWLPQRQV
jgi:hypothetical protein